MLGGVSVGCKEGREKAHVGCKREQEGKRLPGVPEGLAMAEQIISLHGGTIEVESTEGAGTTFTIRLYHS